jgi:hypothetical protein
MTGTLHIAPGDSAASSLHQALRFAERDEKLLVFRDDLSCGPVACGAPATRAKWWQQQFDWPELENDLRSFWAQVDATEERIVVWFGRHSARELSFHLAWAWHMGGRPYHLIDVTALCIPVRQSGDSSGIAQPLKAVSQIPSDGLAALFGKERPISAQEQVILREDWTRLKAENAPFRVVTPTGLVSASMDYFDQSLLDYASYDWKKIALIVGSALAAQCDPYFQTSELTLNNRVVALIDSGSLIADGDPWNMYACRVRLT